MKKRALILAGIPWNTTIQRHHNFAFFLESLGYEVFFIESIPSSKFTIKKLIERIKKVNLSKENKPKVNASKINIQSERFINPMAGIFWTINKFQVKKLVNTIGNEFDVVINYLPINTTNYILESIKSDNIIYDCVRDFENWGGYPKNISDYEKKVILKSNVVTTDSYYLTNKIKNRYKDKKCVQILPTIDEKQIAVLRKGKVKDKIKNILYFGTVGSHLDIDIFDQLIQDGYNIHIIGEIYPGLKLNEGVIHHGFVSDLEMLAKKIVEHADAIIIPYKGNMDGVIPAKLMQCIATGLPIFINRFYDSEVLEKYLYVYKNYTELEDKIKGYSKDKHNEIKKDMITFSVENREELQFEKLRLVINRSLGDV